MSAQHLARPAQASRERRGRSPCGLVRRSRIASLSRSRSVGSGLGAHFGGRRGGGGRIRLEVEQDGGYVNPGDAVDQRVVALADDREAVALEALDQPQLPERLRAVELLGEDPRGEVAQLLLGARRRQGGLADVVVEVEVGVVDPDRAALAEGDEAELLAEARDEVQARLDVVAELFVGRRRAVEDDHRGDVHVGAASLHVEECGVESGQAIRAHGTHLRTIRASCRTVMRLTPGTRRYPYGAASTKQSICRVSPRAAARRSPRRQTRKRGHLECDTYCR